MFNISLFYWYQLFIKAYFLFHLAGVCIRVLYSVFPIRDTVLQAYMPPYMLKKGLDHDLYNGAPFFCFRPCPLDSLSPAL